MHSIARFAAGVAMLLLLPLPSVAGVDTDADGVDDAYDNCTEVANAGQEDSDDDGYGNLCDGDFNNDLVVGLPDLAILGTCMNLPGEGARDGCFMCDLNSDHKVNSLDFSIFEGMVGKPPGPSGVAF
jgi:uncharacterized membrane protein